MEESLRNWLNNYDNPENSEELWQKFIVDLATFIINSEVIRKYAFNYHKDPFDLADTILTRFLEDFNGSQEDDETEYSIIGIPKKRRKIFSKKDLLENMNNYNIEQTINYIRGKIKLHLKYYLYEESPNKPKKNIGIRVNRIFKEYENSNNKDKKTIIEKINNNSRQLTNNYKIDLKPFLNSNLSSKNANNPLIINLKNSLKSFSEDNEIKNGEKINTLIESHIFLQSLDEFRFITKKQIIDSVFDLISSQKSTPISENQKDPDSQNNSLIDSKSDENSLSTEDAAIINYMHNPGDPNNKLVQKAHQFVLNSLNVNEDGTYNPDLPDKPAAKQIKSFIIHNAIKRPTFMEDNGFPPELRERILNLLLQTRSDNAPNQNDDVKANIIGNFLNQRSTTSFEQIKAIRIKIKNEINSVSKVSNNEENDSIIFVNALLKKALEILGDNVENYYIKEKEKENED